jgi:amino acid transporter
MNEKLDRLEDIKMENCIWVIYIGIIILSWYANSKEKRYILYNDLKSQKEYQNLLIFIFSILVIIYYYFTKSSFDDLIDLKNEDTTKKKTLTYASFIGSLLILISGIIFLIIAILDDEIDTELAFN